MSTMGDFSFMKLQPFTNKFVILSALYSDIVQCTKNKDSSRDTIFLLESMPQKDLEELTATVVGF